MIKETLYPTTFAIYDPSKKCGELVDRSALRRKFQNVHGSYISITRTKDVEPDNWLYRTIITSHRISKPEMSSRFIEDAVLDGDLISGARLTRSDLNQLAKANSNLLVDIQDLSRAKEGFVIICDASRLSNASGATQMKADAESLPTFIEFFLDTNVVGVAVEEIGPAATLFKLKWG